MQIDEATYRVLQAAMAAQLVAVKRLGEHIEAALKLMGDVTIVEADRALADFDARHPEIIARIDAEEAGK